MLEQGRTEGGKFAPKSDKPRYVRSIRLTDKTWEELGAIAAQRGITRADLLEQLVEEGVINSASTQLTTGSEKTSLGMESLVEQVLTDPAVTRNGKDKGSVKRGLDALLKLLKLTV